MAVNANDLLEGTRFIFSVRGPIRGQWRLVIDVFNPDGSKLTTCQWHEPYLTAEAAQRAFPMLQAIFRSHMLGCGIETTPLGFA